MAWDRSIPWRQGSVLQNEDLKLLEIDLHDGSDSVFVVLVSHDCDLVQDPENEPSVEVIVGIGISKLDGNYTYGKNPRRLHLEFSDGEEKVWVELLNTQKISIPKARLEKFIPSSLKLEEENRNVLQRWLASRYRRAAFPDEFDRRLKAAKVDRKIARILEPLGKDILAIFFDVDQGNDVTHEDEKDPYRLDIYLVYDTSQDPLAAEKSAKKAARDIESIFESCFCKKDQWINIELCVCEEISDEAVTYRQSLNLKQWRMDHLSLQEEPQHPMMEDT